MREIKFNVWDPNTEKMYRGVGLDKISLYDYQGDNITEQEGLVILQFTGLQDRNGNPIYEGDIVQHRYHPEKRLTVTWGGLGWCLVNENTHWTGWTPIPVTVIGNVHENPELRGGVEVERDQV